jgi:hypothetical protein
MKYMLTFISDRSGMDASPEELKEAMDRWTEFDKEAVEAGALIACEPLEDASGATTIRLGDGGDKAITDGPFAETKEQLGGFALLECTDFDEALSWAKKVPMGGGAIEIRQVMDLTPFGYESSTVGPAKARATA